MIGLMARITLKTPTARPIRYCRIAALAGCKIRNEAPQRIMPYHADFP